MAAATPGDVDAALRALRRARLLVRDLSGSCSSDDVRKARAGLTLELSTIQESLTGQPDPLPPARPPADVLGRLSPENTLEE